MEQIAKRTMWEALDNPTKAIKELDMRAIQMQLHMIDAIMCGKQAAFYKFAEGYTTAAEMMLSMDEEKFDEENFSIATTSALNGKAVLQEEIEWVQDIQRTFTRLRYFKCHRMYR